MDTSMHGNILPVEVLSPGFKFPVQQLTPQDWAKLAIEVHAELTAFPKGGSSLFGVIHNDSYTRMGYVGHKYPNVVGDNARREVLTETVDDSRCSKTTKGVTFVSCLTFGRLPDTGEWQRVKSSRSRKPNSTTKLNHPKSRRTVHLIISTRGFLVVYVYWKSYAEWYKFPCTSGWGIANCGFKTERIVVSEAGSKEIASFIRNLKKTFHRRHAHREDNFYDSMIASTGKSVLDTLAHLQKEVVREWKERQDRALRAQSRIGRTLELLK